jgi:hypothetical protein
LNGFFCRTLRRFYLIKQEKGVLDQATAERQLIYFICKEGHRDDFVTKSLEMIFKQIDGHDTSPLLQLYKYDEGTGLLGLLLGHYGFKSCNDKARLILSLYNQDLSNDYWIYYFLPVNIAKQFIAWRNQKNASGNT